LFTTGPADTLFLKISAGSTPKFNSVLLSDGNGWGGSASAHWTPDRRQVHILNDREIVAVKNRWSK